MTDQPDQPDQLVGVSELAREAQTLTAAIRVLAESTSNLDVSHRRIRRVIALTIAGLALDILLTLGGLALLDNQRDASARIERNSQRVGEVQERTSNKVLCPLYGVFLASYDKAKRDKLPPVQQRRYDGAFRVIREGYATLGCR